jgi:branched-chain amino acid transport system substrate-binding protein
MKLSMRQFGRFLHLALLGIAVLFSSVAAAQNPLKIGFSMPLTGALAAGGKAALLSIQMWQKDINAKGGMLGRQVELVYYDDQTNPASVPGIYTKLLDVDKVDLVISSYGTNVQGPALPLIMQRNMLFMGTLGTAVNDKFNYDRFFQAFPAGPNARLALSDGFFEIAAGMNPKPKTIALVGADAEFTQTALDGARENAKKAGFKIVYDKTYPPNTTDFNPVIRAVQSTNPDVIYVASYPPDSVGMVRAAKEASLKATLFGGAMVGLQFGGIKAQLGPLLNGIVAYDLYVPESTMKFPGIEDFLKRYQELAPKEGVDVLGYYIPPFVYAEMQILEQAVKSVGAIDQGKLADYIRKTTFSTIAGDVRFGARGEWSEPRILFVQYQNITSNSLDQFRKPGTQVILTPKKFKSGDLKAPFSAR